MGDKDDPNLTIGPRAARGSSQTRIMRAIQEVHEHRAARREGVDPVQMFWLGVARNFLLGIPFTGMGFVFFYKTLTRLDKHLATEPFGFHDLIPFIPSALLLLVGVAFLAPGQTLTALRFLGLGNVIDRLPFLGKKEAS